MKLQELINTIVRHVVFPELYLNAVQKVIGINKAFILKGKNEDCSPAEARTWLFPGKALSTLTHISANKGFKSQSPFLVTDYIWHT